MNEAVALLNGGDLVGAREKFDVAEKHRKSVSPKLSLAQAEYNKIPTR
jgi:hypothetical protein